MDKTESSISKLIPINSSESRKAILGPFSLLLSLSGFDLERSIFSNKSSLVRAWISTVIFIIILILFLFRVFSIMLATVDPLSYSWAQSNILGFSSIHALASACCLASWTSKGVFTTIFKELSSIRIQYSSLSLPSSSVTHIKALIFCSIFISIAVVTSVQSIIQGRFNPNATVGSTWFFSIDNLFGLEPLISIWMSIASALATTVYVFLHLSVKTELIRFNDDLKEATERKTLAYSLKSLASRQSSLHNLVSILSQSVSIFASISVFSIAIVNINAIFIFSSFKNEMNILAQILGILWMNASIALLLFTLNPPGSLQELLNTAGSIVIKNEGVIENVEKMSLASIMMKRIRVSPTRIVLMNAFNIYATTPHIIMLISPNVGIMLSYARRFM